jgi:hypothetical protein
MVAAILGGLAAVVLLLVIAFVADTGLGTPAVVASLFLKLLAGIVMLIILATVVGLGYILLCTPSSPPI